VKKEFMGVSLYIGNLSPKTFDLDLYKHFKSKGYAIAGVKVMFSKESRQSRGYGYLNFYADEEAQRCLEEMNNAVIDGKQIVLSKKKDKDFDSKANVLVRNLPKEMDQKGLSDLFSKYGNIKSAKLEVFQDGQSRGFGYIQFETQESAEKAIKELNNSNQHGKKIEVQCHVKKEDREEQGEKYTNLFIQNLPHDFSDDELKKLFSQYGAIGSASVNLKKNGTGFVSFKSHEDAKTALEATHMKTKVKEQSILVSQHIQRKENDLAPSASNPIIKNQKEAFKSNIFVRFIPKDVTEEQLKAKFSEAGSIASIKLKNHMQTINGEAFSNYKIGYVLYDDVQSAQRCIKMFDEQNVFGFAQKPLSVDFWQSQVDLKQQTEEKNAANLKQLINYVM
jgi:polyadenylate-binding protein